MPQDFSTPQLQACQVRAGVRACRPRICWLPAASRAPRRSRCRVANDMHNAHENNNRRQKQRRTTPTAATCRTCSRRCSAT
jgi:hypothetical protein